MSKKLDSILQQAPHATAKEQNKKYNDEIPIFRIEKTERITVEVPSNIKKQIKQYMADHPGETVKTIILKGLKEIGFNIEEKYLYDLRIDK